MSQTDSFKKENLVIKGHKNALDGSMTEAEAACPRQRNQYPRHLMIHVEDKELQEQHCLCRAS